MYRKNAWEKYKKSTKEVMNFCDGYMNYITVGKTERLATKESVRILEANGFVNAETLSSVKEGDRIYFVNKNKNVCAFILGSEKIEKGKVTITKSKSVNKFDEKVFAFTAKYGNEQFFVTGGAALAKEFYGSIGFTGVKDLNVVTEVLYDSTDATKEEIDKEERWEE